MDTGDKPIRVLELLLLFFGSFAMFTFSLMKAIIDFELIQLIIFFMILIFSLIIFSLVLFKIFERNKFLSPFLSKY